MCPVNRPDDGVLKSCPQVGALLGLVLLRWVVAGASWAVAGRAIWFLPNMLSEVRGSVALTGRKPTR